MASVKMAAAAVLFCVIFLSRLPVKCRLFRAEKCGLPKIVPRNIWQGVFSVGGVSIMQLNYQVPI